MEITLGAGAGGTGCGDAPQVIEGGRKVGAGIGAQETAVHGVRGTKVGTDEGTGDSVG